MGFACGLQVVASLKQDVSGLSDAGKSVAGLDKRLASLEGNFTTVRACLCCFSSLAAVGGTVQCARPVRCSSATTACH